MWSESNLHMTGKRSNMSCEKVHVSKQLHYQSLWNNGAESSSDALPHSLPPPWLTENFVWGLLLMAKAHLVTIKHLWNQGSDWAGSGSDTLAVFPLTGCAGSIVESSVMNIYKVSCISEVNITLDRSSLKIIPLFIVA